VGWPTFTEQQVIAALAAFHAAHGRWPTRRDWQQRRAGPSYAFVVRRFGWAEAIAMAGGVARPAGVVYCRNGHDRTVNTVVGPDGTRRCRLCLRVRLRGELRDRRAADLLPAYPGDVLPSTVAHLQRLGPAQLAEVQRATEDELAEAARHIARLVALREAIQRREAELAAAERPSAARRMEIAAAAAMPRYPPTSRRPRARGASSPR
jgi:hypothetical protein